MATDQTQEKQARALTWPYTSFKTFLNVLGRFKGAIPPRIDRSALGGSEGQKTQVLGTLRFFGLIGENGEVTPAFAELINNEKDRARLTKELLEKHYPDAIRLGSINGTTNQLAETFGGVTGETQRKAMTFFLHAAKFAHVPISKNFKIPSGYSRQVSRRRGGPGAPQEGDDSNGMAPASSLTDTKARYLEMLMEKAKTAEGQLDEKLLDRIERLLGYGQDEEEANDNA
jgi:hypothetical protein